MPELLIRHADAVVTMNGGREEIAGGDVLLGERNALSF